MSDRLDVYLGPGFWDELRGELKRTGVASLDEFDRQELAWIIDRFALYWGQLQPVLDDFPQRRFADFVSVAGYRFTVDGWQHVDGRIELVDIEVVTWDHPEL